MEARKRLDCLHLHDDPIVDEEVETVACIQDDVLVDNRQSNLFADNKPARSQFVRQTRFISGFQ